MQYAKKEKQTRNLNPTNEILITSWLFLFKIFRGVGDTFGETKQGNQRTTMQLQKYVYYKIVDEFS